MKSPNITSGRAVKTSAGWLHGVNSVRNPWTLPENQVKWAQNINFRGGVAQTRNGFDMRLSLPQGNFQGGIIFNANKQSKAPSVTTNLSGVKIVQPKTIFTPQGTDSLEVDLPYALFCVDGKVYYAPFPLTQPANWSSYQLTNIQLDPSVKKVNFVIATQQASTNVSGNVTITPSHRIVVIQDGINTPCYWDGSDITGQLALKMPVGYWMSFSGNRLWVANGNIISASDLANPLGWSERTQGAGRGDFSVPRPVTGMRDFVGQNNNTTLYVFTSQSTYSLASGILDRSTWASTPNFQSTLFPSVGCIAGDSITFQAGLMWWYAQGGLVSADVAANNYLSSQVLYKDLEMAKVKRLIPSDASGICSTAFENYLLVSVPYLETLNSATMVLDYAAASELSDGRSPAWAGVWTGIRPISWSSNVINSQPRLFAFSVDYSPTSDGSFNHLWEAFSPNRYDTYLNVAQDGSTTQLVNRIYCQLETALLGDSMDKKQFVYADMDCSQLAGTIDVRTSYRGTKGAYQQILNTRLLAVTEPYQYATSPVAKQIEDLGFLQTQSRRLVTENVSRAASIKSCESSDTMDVDKAFSLLIEWCGSMGVDSVRMFQDPWSDTSYGKPSGDETTPCVVGENGSSIVVSLEPAPEENPSNALTSWASTQTRTYTTPPCPSGQTAVRASATATASFTSYVSLADAVAQAGALALQEATNAATQYRVANPCH